MFIKTQVGPLMVRKKVIIYIYIYMAELRTLESYLKMKIPRMSASPV